ncbi:MAG TPA: hypothetical protein PKY81_00655 [bacterium]|nr:hypothetical protein [bacterium]
MQSLNVSFFYSNLHNPKEIEILKEKFASVLSSKFTISKGAEDLKALAILTGGVENDVVKFISQNKPTPIILLYHNSSNSLPAALELTTYLKEKKHKVFLFCYKDIENIIKITAVSNVYKNLSLSNVGLIGAPSDWLIASSVSNVFFRDNVRKLVKIRLSEIYDLFEKSDNNEYDAHIKNKIERYKSYVSAEELVKSLKMYTVLKTIRNKYQLDCFSIRCFDILEKYKTTSCLALSLLNGEGIISGCEGDMQTLMTMYITKLLTHTIPFMANPSDIDYKENKLTVAHCACAFELVKKSSLAINTHFESNLGTAVQGCLEDGIYTIVKFGGKNMERFFASRAKTCKHQWKTNLCRTQAVLSVEENLKDYIDNPIGNHLVLVKGDFVEILRLWNKYRDI